MGKYLRLTGVLQAFPPDMAGKVGIGLSLDGLGFAQAYFITIGNGRII